MLNHKYYNKVVVAIHGVGDAKEGGISDGLTKDLNILSYDIKVLMIGNRRNHITENQDGSEAIIEVNWTDLMKPSKGVYGVFRHFFLLLMSMLNIINERHKNIFVRAFVVIAMTISPGAIILSLVMI